MKIGRPSPWRIALAVSMVAVACADLRDVNTGECGNGVVDRGEDCDSPVPDPACGAKDTLSECRFLCAGAICPSGYTCGVDDVCRRGYGVFEQTEGSPWQLSGDIFSIGDIDGDQNADIIGLGRAGVTARFGDLGGNFDDELHLPLVFMGLPGLGDTEEDGDTDLIATSELGLLLFRGSDDRRLVSVPFQQFATNEVHQGIRMVNMQTGIDLTLSPVNSLLVLLDNLMCLADYCDGGGVSLLPAPVGMPAMPFLANQLAGDPAVGKLDGWIDFYDEVGLAFSGDPRVFIYEVEDPLIGPSRLVERQRITMPFPILYGVRFVDANDDGALDVIASVDGPAGTDEVAVALGDGSGRFLAPAIDTRFSMLADPAFCGDAQRPQQWPLAVADFDGDGDPDFVGTGGVCRADPVWTRVGTPAVDLPWSSAVVGDLNGDGRLDVAAGFEEQNGIDFFLGNGLGLFNRFHVDTDGPASFLRIGDFDGDYVGDLAIVETTPEEQIFAIMYGDLSGAPSFPVLITEFLTVEDIAVTSLVSPLLPSTVDLITDLYVVSSAVVEGEGGSPEKEFSVSLLIGNSAQTMLSPVLPYQPTPDSVAFPFMAAIGRFVPKRAGDDEAVRDIFSIWVGVRFLPGGGITLGDFEVRFLRGSSVGYRFFDDKVVAYPNVPFTEACSMVVVGDLDGDGLDSIVAVDGALPPPEAEEACALDPHGGAAGPRLLIGSVDELPGGALDPTIETRPLPGSYRQTRGLALHDFDGDARPELVVAFAGEGDPPVGDGVVVYWNDGTTIRTDNPSDVPIGAGEPLDAVAINIDDDLEEELAVLVSTDDPETPGKEGEIRFFEFDAQRVFAEVGSPHRVNDLSVKRSQILAADVDRDGITDLIVTSGQKVFVLRALEIRDQKIEEGAR